MKTEKIMRVLLVHPYGRKNPHQDKDIGNIPIGLYYIGATLAFHGYDVHIVDLSNFGDDPDAVKALLCDLAPDVIGISVLQYNRKGALELADAAKVLNPEVKIVLGGVEATFLWRLLLQSCPSIDFVVTGEGESAFPALLNVFEKNTWRPETLQIPGLAFRKNGRPVRPLPPEPIEDLDALPHPARYFDFSFFSLTRGCPGRCTFCSSPKFWGRRIRSHSVDYAVDNLEMLYKRGITHFYISDDTFTRDSEKVIAFCKEIIRRGLNITWWAISRVDCVNPAMLAWMRRAGCLQISYGVESGSPDIRRRLGKPIKEEDIENAFKLTVANAMIARAYFICGAPGETWETINQSLDLVQRIKPLQAIFTPLGVAPGTALFERIKKQTGVDDTIWLEHDNWLYAEASGEMPAQTVHEFAGYLEENHDTCIDAFAQAIVLNSKPGWEELNAHFLAYLANLLTVYNESINAETIRMLYLRALAYAPDHKAYAGLSRLAYETGRYQGLEQLTAQALKHYPNSILLKLYRGLGLFDQGYYQNALTCLAPLAAHPHIMPLLIQCSRELGDDAQSAYYRELYHHYKDLDINAMSAESDVVQPPLNFSHLVPEGPEHQNHRTETATA